MQNLDSEKLLSEVESVVRVQPWIPRTNNSWHAIPLRSIDGEISPQHVTHGGVHFASSASAFKDTELMLHCPYIAKIIADLQTPVYKVRLMRMDAKGILPTHADTFPFPNVCRLHITVKTNDQAIMVIAGKRMHLGESKLWFTNVRQLHSVENTSDKERIHVVFDVDWCDNLAKLLDASQEIN